MTEIDRDKLEAMDDIALEELHADLETRWQYLDRRPDPHLTYTKLQEPIQDEQRIIKEILASRHSSEGQGS